MEKAALSDCEQMVMKCIWNSKEDLGVQELTEIVNQRYERTWKLQTVSTFLARLVKKGYLEMYRRGRTFFYKPLVEEKEYKIQLMEEYIEFWNAGSIVEFVCTLCESPNVSEEEKQKIKKTFLNIG